MILVKPTAAKGSAGKPAQEPCAGHRWTLVGFLQPPRRMHSQMQMQTARWARAEMVRSDLTSFEPGIER